MTRATSHLLGAALCALTLLAAGCGGAREDPILRLSSTEALEIGKQLLAEEKYNLARRHLVHAFEVEPNSETGREGLLLAADALFLRGGYESYVEAEQRYRDFLNRFPTSDRAAYAQFRLAASLAERMEKPDRDQQIARRALTEFENVRRLYPTSEYAGEAAQKVVDVRSHLAEHEFVVGFFYYRYGNPSASGKRLQDMLAAYPDYPEPDKVLAYMCLNWEAVLDRARFDRGLEEYDYLEDACERLREEFPDSNWTKKIPTAEKLRKLRGKLPDTPPRPARRRRGELPENESREDPPGS